jgi:hypothetical protein
MISSTRIAVPWQAARVFNLDRLLLGMAVALGAVLRLAGLGRHSFWTDELYVIWEARQPLHLLFDPQIHIHHPPGYRLALHVWMYLGSSEVWLRLLPAIAGLLLIPVAWGLARVLWSSRPWFAHAAALLVATSPYLLHYSQDVTTYSWTTLWVTGSMLLLALSWRLDRAWLWAMWSVSLAAALYSHYFSLFPLLIEGLMVPVLAALAPRGHWGASRKAPLEKAARSMALRRLWHAALAILGSITLYAPWIYMLMTRSGGQMNVFMFPLTWDYQPLNWVPTLLVGYANREFWQHYPGQSDEGVWWVWSALTVASLWITWRLGKRLSAGKVASLMMVCGWAVVATFGPYIFLRLTTPPGAVDPVRFATFAAPALLIGLGAVIGSLAAPLRFLMVAGWLALAGAQWRAEVSAPPIQDWRAMLSKVAEGARPGDAFLAFPSLHAGAAAAYYAPNLPMPVSGGWIVPAEVAGSDLAYWFPVEWQYAGFYNRHAYRSTDWQREIATRTDGALRIWYLAGDGERDGTYPRSQTLEAVFLQVGWRQSGEWRASPLVLKLYVKGEN